jgi:hypothetical protein
LNRVDGGAFSFCRPFFQKIRQISGVPQIKPTIYGSSRSVMMSKDHRGLFGKACLYLIVFSL